MLTVLQAHPSQAKDSPTAWTDNEDLLLFFEAVTKIQADILAPENTRLMVQRSIQTYLRARDKYSDYLRPEEYRSYKRSLDPEYGGVGMDIFADPDGRFICVPFPDSPAALGGIQYGDVLMKINNLPVEGQSVLQVGARIRGAAGSRVELLLQNNAQNVYAVALTRETIQANSVILKNTNPLFTIKIVRFTKRTAEELKEIYTRVGNKGRAVVLDLRGNTGGDLFAAIDAASLFLKPGSKIISLRMHSEIKQYTSQTQPLDTNSRLFLWQDRYTASATEIFIAALTENQRAVSIGVNSFGKGLAQKIVELSDGSAIVVTYASLVTPLGQTFHETGLAPNYVLNDSTTQSEQAYVDAVNRLLQ